MCQTGDFVQTVVGLVRGHFPRQINRRLAMCCRSRKWALPWLSSSTKQISTVPALTPKRPRVSVKDNGRAKRIGRRRAPASVVQPPIGAQMTYQPLLVAAPALKQAEVVVSVRIRRVEF